MGLVDMTPQNLQQISTNMEYQRIKKFIPPKTIVSNKHVRTQIEG